MEDQREDDPSSPAPEPELEIVVPEYVYSYATRDFTPQIVKDKETLELMRPRRKGRSR